MTPKDNPELAMAYAAAHDAFLGNNDWQHCLQAMRDGDIDEATKIAQAIRDDGLAVAGRLEKVKHA